MLTGQIGLVHGNSGFWAPIIQTITDSPYNHCFVMINETQCVSAEPGGAVIRDINHYATDNIVWSHLELRTWQRRRITTQARTFIGTPYSWVDFVAAGLGALLKSHTPKWIAERTATRRHLICSQLCDLSLQAAGIHLFTDDRPPGGITPGTFGRYYQHMGWIR